MHDGLAGLRRGELAGVDRRAAADYEDPIGIVRHLDAMRGDLRPGGDLRQVEEVPARARNQERTIDPDLGEGRRQVVEAPADDHGSRSRA